MGNKIKAVMVTPEFPPECGGIGYYVYYLARELRRAGHGVSIIVRGSAYSTQIRDGITVREVRVGGIPPLNQGSFGRAVERLLALENPDIVHVHYGAAMAIKCGCPVVVTAHWCNKVGIPIFHRPVRNAEALLRNLFLPLYVRSERRLSRSCDRLTTVSASLRDEYREHYGVEGAVINNGVDPQAFSSNGVRREDLVLFAGMLRPGKGVLDLLAVAELLKESRPGARVLLVGDGPLRDEVRRRMAERGLHNVEMLGRLSHPELLSYYRRARVFVLPTYYEGFPNTVLEAMACELPVVASRVSGIPEQVEEGVTGHMVPPGDVEGFHRRVGELLRDEGRCERFGRAGRERVLRRFTWRHVSERVLGEYRDLLNHRGEERAR
ncbi:MAG: glycosyltransferase family 4 protein [Nitrospirota bacterium]|jgi:glycosyltransferase involved in cell wall biosynthesis